MADLDMSLVAAVQQGGKPALRQLLESGFTASLLEGEGKKAYEYVVNFYKQYGELPTAPALAADTGIMLVPTAEPLRYIVDTLYERKLHKALFKGVEEIADHLENKRPLEGRATVEQLLRTLRQLDTRSALVESLPGLGDKVIDYYDRIKRGERGIQTPWPTINESTMGFWPEDLILFAARLGQGKCVHADTEITDPDTGVVRTIREVVEGPQPNVWTWSEEKGIHSAPITAKVDTGRKNCFRFTFASGRTIVVTPEHPLLTAEGWKRADEFSPGMTAALPSRLPAPAKPVSLPDDTVFLLALLLSEGSYTGNHVGFSSADPAIVQRARELAESLGLQLKQHGKYDYDFAGTKGKSNPVRELLRLHGLDKTLAKHKTLPDAVYRLPLPQLSQFLSTFWMCDGYVDSNAPGITLASERMVRQLQHLLLRFGVQSRVEPKKARTNGKTFSAWRLKVYSTSWEAFAGAVPLYGEKARKLSALLAKDRNPNVGFPRVSDEFMATLRAETSVGGRDASRKVGALLGRKGRFEFRKILGGGARGLSLRSLQALCEVHGLTDKYRWMWDSDIFWDSVTRIEPVGEQKIYDLTVAPTSCFVANDIIVHNTWVLLQMAGCAWEQGKKVLVATTEMAKERMAMRYFAYKFRLPYDQLRKGQLDSFSEQKFRDGVASMMNSPNLNIVGGDFDFSMETFAGIVQDEQPDIVFVDGAYLMKVPGLTRTERAANVFDELKRIAKRTRCAVVATTQFNREVKQNQAKTVQSDSIALTDVAGWNADLMFGLIQTEEMKQNKRMAFKPLKVREGSGEEIECNWDFTLMDFSEIPKANAGGTQLVMPSGVPTTNSGAGTGDGFDLF